jgi:galactose mutarotase-like enzyme
MNLLQLTALIPGHGELPILVSPPLDEVESMLTGAGPDANGALSATMGGAFLVPWAGHLLGKPAPTPGILQTLWLGQRLTFPASAPGSSLSTLGLLLNRGADSTHNDVILDGQSVEAIFHPGTFSGNWPSPGSVHVLAEMSGHTMDLTVTVQNTGSIPIPVGVGWLPYFSIASQNREKATLSLPSSTRLETNRSTSIPTGRMLPVSGTPLDFSPARGVPLGHRGIDDTFVHLTPGVLANGPVVELRDTVYGYGIRISPLTGNIKALRVIAPSDKPWVAIGPYTNFDDPLGSQWETSEGSGIATVQPGDTLQWKVRVEIFTFTAGDKSSAT